MFYIRLHILIIPISQNRQAVHYFHLVSVVTLQSVYENGTSEICFTSNIICTLISLLHVPRTMCGSCIGNDTIYKWNHCRVISLTFFTVKFWHHVEEVPQASRG